MKLDSCTSLLESKTQTHTHMESDKEERNTRPVKGKTIKFTIFSWLRKSLGPVRRKLEETKQLANVKRVDDAMKGNSMYRHLIADPLYLFFK